MLNSLRTPVFAMHLFIPTVSDQRRLPLIFMFCLLLPQDHDDWSGVFSGGQEYPLLWKEGEVYLLPLTEEDIGFYNAPGESEHKIIDI